MIRRLSDSPFQMVQGESPFRRMATMGTFSAAKFERPSLAEFIANFGAEWGPKYFARGYSHISHARRDHDSRAAFRSPAPKAAAPKVDPAIARIRQLEAEQSRLKQAVEAKAEIDKLTAQRDALESQLAAPPKPKGLAGRLTFAKGVCRIGRKRS
jgi:hypothetical protein